MVSVQLPPNDLLLASAAQFLIEGGDHKAANVLLSCRLEVSYTGEDNSWSTSFGVVALLSGPRAAYDILDDWDHPATHAIKRAIGAVLPYGTYLDRLHARGELIQIDPNWRAELLEIARGRGILNQAALASTSLIVWRNLKFRSQSEVRIAEALDRAGVLFLPNCSARLGASGTRQNREADFLVCLSGKWGILEVDGEPFHPPQRTAEDHERDRLFRQHGISHVEHYDATRCYQDADGVVSQFLSLLKQS